MDLQQQLDLLSKLQDGGNACFFYSTKNFALRRINSLTERARAPRRLICMHSANHFCFADVHRSHEFKHREANVRKSGQDDSQSTLSALQRGEWKDH